jgi:hypothetical protein
MAEHLVREIHATATATEACTAGQRFGRSCRLAARTLVLSRTHSRVGSAVMLPHHGGFVDAPVRRLASRRIGPAGVPVVAVATDTYETVSAVLRVRGAIGPGSERKIAAQA